MHIRLSTGKKTEVYALLARLLAAEYGLSALPDLAHAPGGKPWFPHHPDLYFNVSHSGSLLLAAAGAVPLGVDVETVHPRRTGLPRHVLSREEYDWFQSRGAQWEDFYTLWTLKESRVKCLGDGLRRPANTVTVPLLVPGQAGMLDGLSFHAYGGEGWRAGACAQAQRPVWSDILKIS